MQAEIFSETLKPSNKIQLHRKSPLSSILHIKKRYLNEVELTCSL